MARITYRKTRKGETIDIRADKGEDLRSVVKAMAVPTAALLTADTITDEQIRELLNEARNEGNSWRELICNDALGMAVSDRLPARAHLAQILNARKDAK